jgi:hypothetical protein
MLVGIIAEVVSATAVVVTLMFLSIEPRNSRKITVSVSMDGLSIGFNSLNALVVEDGEFAQIYVRGTEDPSSLIEPDLTRYVFWGQSLIDVYATVKKHHDSGVLPEEEWIIYSTAVAAFINSPGGRWLSENIVIPRTLRAEVEKFRDPKINFTFTASSPKLP